MLIADPNRVITLSSCDGDGTPNSAIFGAVFLEGEHLRLGSGENRTLRNLQQNPRATMMIFVPGYTVLNYQGIRLYLELANCEKCGPVLEAIREKVTHQAGRSAARMILYVLTFRIVETRPLVDLAGLSPSP